MNSKLLSVHHFFKAIILLGFAIYIVYLVKTDHILYYIAPRMVDYVKASALALYAIGVYQIYQAIRTMTGVKAACGCNHDHTPSSSLLKNSLIYGLFCFPLLLGFMLPDTTLNSSLAAKKGMNLSSATTVKQDIVSSPASSSPPLSPESSNKLEDMFPSDKFTQHYAAYAKELYPLSRIPVKEDLFLETLTTIDLYLDKFVGKEMQITGFVYRQDDMTPTQFVVGRFAIQCCSADASPYGVLVDYPRAEQFADDSWITVTGTIQQAKFNEIDVIMLKVASITKAEPAKAQYVYPNFDFGS